MVVDFSGRLCFLRSFAVLDCFLELELAVEVVLVNIDWEDRLVLAHLSKNQVVVVNRLHFVVVV